VVRLNKEIAVRSGHFEFQIFAFRQRSQRGANFLDDGQAVQGLQIQLDLAGFNPGEVQRVIDERLFEAGHEGTPIMGGRIELLPRRPFQKSSSRWEEPHRGEVPC